MEITVAELAQRLQLDCSLVSKAAGCASGNQLISASRLDELLARLKEKYGPARSGWDISSLDPSTNEWDAALRGLYSQPVAFPASLPPSQGRQLREIALNAKARNCAEIGCFIGVSSLWLGSAIRDNGGGKLVSIDLFDPKYPIPAHYSYLEDPLGVATRAARESGLAEIIEFRKSESARYAKKLSGSPPLDLVFIDGDHTFLGIARDFVAYFPLLRQGGIAVLHDTNPKHCRWHGPRKFIDRYLSSSQSVSVEEIQTVPNYGIAIIKKLDDSRLPFSPAISLKLRCEIAAASTLRRLLGSAPARAAKHSVRSLRNALARR
jgi:predicted O-methyltransferase YrrM